MAKKISDSILDAMLALCEGTHIHVCSAEPANFAGIAAVELASAAITGSYAKANGDTSGRKNTVPAQSGLSIATGGQANHIVVSNNTDTIYLITTCPAQTLVAGGTVDLAAFSHEIGDPT